MLGELVRLPAITDDAYGMPVASIPGASEEKGVGWATHHVALDQPDHARANGTDLSLKIGRMPYSTTLDVRQRTEPLLVRDSAAAE